MEHPHLVDLIETFEDDRHFCLVTESIQGGELFDHIINLEHFDEKEVRYFMVPVFEAVMACHVEGLVHTDLKPEYLLLKDSGDCHIKVQGFGLAHSVEHSIDDLIDLEVL